MGRGRWRITPAEAKEIQLSLRARRIDEAPAGLAARYVAGADISMKRFGRTAYGAIVVLDARTLETVEQVTAQLPLDFPYVPGLLSFRELPVLEAAWAKLRIRPDVIVFDGHGTLHPRRFGLACHGGLVFDIPSIGCAKSLYIGEHASLPFRRWSGRDILVDGEVEGRALRTRAGVAPVYVSPGHRMDLDSAVRIIRGLVTRYREPETTRRAHRLANEARRSGGD